MLVFPNQKRLFLRRIVSAVLVSIALWCVVPAAANDKSGTLPNWLLLDQAKDSAVWLKIPSQLKDPLPSLSDLRFLILEIDQSWSPDWKAAAFDLKNLIVAAKTLGQNVRVGIQAGEPAIGALMDQELAAYIDGYLFRDAPSIPAEDETGKLWQFAEVEESQVLSALVEASSLGIELVIFEGLALSPDHQAFLGAVRDTSTGSLDIQPEVFNMPQDEAIFFFQPDSGNYHLAVYGKRDETRTLYFSLAENLAVSLIYPEQAVFKAKQYGKRTEISLSAEGGHYLFKLVPGERVTSTESLKIVAKGAIDPYELVVKNQVFKDREEQKFQSLEVDELLNYRYQTPGGQAIDVTFEDTVIVRRDQPVERLRREVYIGGVKWKQDRWPGLPLIQPEKIQRAPLVIDLNKSYSYTYEGEDTIAGHRCWKVGFSPKNEGDFLSGTVWIDQQSGAHRRLRAIQSGLEPPVVGNEIVANFDWVEDNGERYWTLVGENNLQVLNVVGVRLGLQIQSTRTNFRFNRAGVEEVLAKAYASDLTILRDTAQGFRYLVKRGEERVVSENTYLKQRGLLGGVLYDPGLDTPIPLAGFNYTNLDFMKRGYQANFFVAGAINDLIVSNPDFLGKSWDLTGELFLSPLYFEDSIYEAGEKRDDLTIKSIRESFNLTLGIPIGSFFKISGNYGLRLRDFKAADDTDPNFVIPVGHIENIFRLNLQFDRQRFATELEYEWIGRSKWEPWGLPGNPEALPDQFRRLTLDASLSKRWPKFNTVRADVRYLKGWDLDRFSRFGFGFLENSVSGFGTSGIEATEAVRLRLVYEVGVKGLFQLTTQLDGARAWLELPDPAGNLVTGDPVDLYGVGVSMNVLGPFKTLVRMNVGYGIDSDLADEAGNLTGQIVFIRLF